MHTMRKLVIFNQNETKDNLEAGIGVLEFSLSLEKFLS